jgi:hypothetical protein
LRSLDLDDRGLHRSDHAFELDRQRLRARQDGDRRAGRRGRGPRAPATDGDGSHEAGPGRGDEKEESEPAHCGDELHVVAAGRE